MRKVKSKEAKVVTLAMNELLMEWKPYIHTITADNGKEFAGHEQVAEKLCIDYYFAHPYHSWERGSNENLNGLIRQYIPKGSSFEHLNQKDLERIQNELNNRPRKRYQYLKPIEVYYSMKMDRKVAFIA